MKRSSVFRLMAGCFPLFLLFGGCLDKKDQPEAAKEAAPAQPAAAPEDLLPGDWEAGVNFPRLREERFLKAQAAVRARGLGAALCFDMDNIRYLTGTLIGNVFRDFLDHYALCPREGKPFLFDPAVPSKRITCPWLEDRMEAPITILRGALPPETWTVFSDDGKPLAHMPRTEAGYRRLRETWPGYRIEATVTKRRPGGDGTFRMGGKIVEGVIDCEVVEK